MHQQCQMKSLAVHRVQISQHWEENMKARAAVAERPGMDREDSALLPRAGYVFFTVVISCKILLAAGTGTSVCFSPQSWMSALRTRLIYQAGIKMTLGAAGEILPPKSCIGPTDVFRY